MGTTWLFAIYDFQNLTSNITASQNDLSDSMAQFSNLVITAV